MDDLRLPQRRGPKPRTTSKNPHQQLDQNAPPAFQERLFDQALSLPGVITLPSRISVPGARGFILAPDAPLGPPDAFMIGREFAHLHPPYDGSLHLRLPMPAIETLLAAGWGELHPSAPPGFAPGKTVMVWGPQDEAELETVWRILRFSHAYATAS
jgi:phospholipase/carboxylesterase